MNRRKTLKILGASGAVAVLAVGGGARYVTTRTPTRALAPWEQASFDFDDPRMDALSYAILAPNPHNRQPWIVAFEGADSLAVYCDPARRLPETDPFDRQITIGLGAFVDLFRMAAAANGYATRLDAFPQGEPAARLDRRPVARITLRREPGIGRPPLFDFVLARRSNKEPYDPARTVPAAALRTLAAIASGPVAAGADGTMESVEYMRDLTWRAHEVEMTTPAKLQESVDLMRIGKAEIEANPDGIDLGGPMLGAMAGLGLLDRESLADPSSMAFESGMDMYRELTGTAMAHIWLTTPGNSRREQLAAGRDWLRINLAAARLGIAVQPFSQALQEYDEMAALYREVHDRLAPDGGTVQMLGRLGYGPEIGPSPRWPAQHALRTAGDA